MLLKVPCNLQLPNDFPGWRMQSCYAFTPEVYGRCDYLWHRYWRLPLEWRNIHSHNFLRNRQIFIRYNQQLEGNTLHNDGGSSWNIDSPRRPWPCSKAVNCLSSFPRNRKDHPYGFKRLSIIRSNPKTPDVPDASNISRYHPNSPSFHYPFLMAVLCPFDAVHNRVWFGYLADDWV